MLTSALIFSALFSACNHANTVVVVKESPKSNGQTVNFKGKPVELRGTTKNVGDNAPKVTVVSAKLQEVSLGGQSDITQIIVTVPSVDTPVCDLEARTFNEKVADRKDVTLTIVSMDSPFAAKRYCAAKGIDNITIASDFRNHDLGEAYGIVVNSGPIKGVLARAIFVIKNGKIVYKELVPEIASEPNYDKALAAIK